jgi:type IV pilus modification protein PilV
MTKQSILQRGGFSMVEVVVALAVIAVGILGVLGMLPNALDSSRNAADNTLSATIVQDTFNTIRSQRFHTVDLGVTSGFGFTPATYDLKDPLTGSAFFDQSGMPTANAQDYYYKVVLNFTPQGTLPVSLITATVTWPDKGTAVVPPNKNIFFAEVANYQ